jgi:hypothetical protein
MPRLLDVPAALLLSHALRASTTLTYFQLCEADLWDDSAAAVLLLSALTLHPSLRELGMSHNIADTPAMQCIAGATLGALVAANGPALHTLDVACCRLGDIGMGPLVDALRYNTHLRTLVCNSNGVTEAFARDRLLPAVQANGSLQKLVPFDRNEEEEWPAITRALRDLVAARAAAGAPQ